MRLPFTSAHLSRGRRGPWLTARLRRGRLVVESSHETTDVVEQPVDDDCDHDCDHDPAGYEERELWVSRDAFYALDRAQTRALAARLRVPPPLLLVAIDHRRRRREIATEHLGPWLQRHGVEVVPSVFVSYGDPV